MRTQLAQQPSPLPPAVLPYSLQRSVCTLTSTLPPSPPDPLPNLSRPSPTCSYSLSLSHCLTLSREGRFRTTAKGEIVFQSREDLAALVADFSYQKLKELAAASRALARYVDDLEGELEAADDVVVKLRREVTKSEQKLSEAATESRALQSQADELGTALSVAQQQLDQQQAALEEAERAAERASDQLLDLQSSAGEDVEAGKEEATSRAVRLERELMKAEDSATSLQESKARLEDKVATLQQQQQLAAEGQRTEADRVRQLEEKAAAAEAKAEAKAESLVASESSVASLQDQLDELKRALAESAQGNVVASAPGTSAVSSNGAVPSPDANSTVGSAPDAVSSAASLSSAEASSGASATAGGATFDDEAARLTKEIERQISASAGGGKASKSATGGGGGGGRAALSRMKKADLVAECKERKLEATGSMAELRAALRVERKRDSLVEQVVERGWSERQARTALKKVSWDVDAAIAKLLKR